MQSTFKSKKTKTGEKKKKKKKKSKPEEQVSEKEALSISRWQLSRAWLTTGKQGKKKYVKVPEIKIER